VSTNWPTVLANLSHPQSNHQKENYISLSHTGGMEPSNYAPSKEGVKREARHEHAVHELDDARQDKEDEERIDEF
jgi:hypothetical protein